MTELKASRAGGATRRQDFSAATRRDLLDVAQRLFTEQGYAATSLDSIVAGASVTKGALYHHFDSKTGVFEAVFTRVDEASAREIQQAVAAETDPWRQASGGLRVFLEVVRRPAYRRIVVQEGPAVLGPDRVRAEESRPTFALVHRILEGILGAGGWTTDDATVRTFSRLFFGALNTAGAAVALSDDPETEVARVEQVVGLLLAAVRQLVESGADLAEVTARVLPRDA
ncbi:TetR/AcrR family transcriptional regulator [Nocardioides solisilvae]|uniref:TetR/AcrR family transcriptional regulator n=1 Tax=Nocardioides solisilvae TaxID=1542435 RepID=UPI000D740CC1|nr:TetR family transcriptional regulator [Nocardioides solisilvae]